MFKSAVVGISAAIVGVLLGTTWSQAQQVPMAGVQMQHEQMMGQAPGQRIPTLPGQDAFGAIQEIVRILEADPTTDWSKVNLERLRQHLIDMNDVTLRSEVKTAAIPGGLAMDVTGAGRTEQAIRRMVAPHTVELNSMPQWSAGTEEIPGGLRLTVVARDPADAKTVARIRGLGFIGLLVQGAHHQTSPTISRWPGVRSSGPTDTERSASRAFSPLPGRPEARLETEGDGASPGPARAGFHKGASIA